MRRNGVRYRLRELVRRCTEASFAVVLVALLSPVLLVVAVAVRVALGSPVLFRQERPGRYGQTFTLYKFRTMRDAFDARGEPLDDELRLTRLGRLLRATSIDELPELFNIIRGDMSFVGPRPLLVEYLPLYTPEQARRHDVRPGITGLAQISGRNELPWDERFVLDVYYVDHQSLALDLKIIAATIGKVLRREGIAAEGYTAAPRFTGQPADSHEGKASA